MMWLILGFIYLVILTAAFIVSSVIVWVTAFFGLGLFFGVLSLVFNSANFAWFGLALKREFLCFCIPIVIGAMLAGLLGAGAGLALSLCYVSRLAIKAG